MSINLIHPSLNKVGGAERVCLSFIQTFKEEGYFVTLYTIDKVQWNLLEKTFGDIVKPDKETFLYTIYPDVKSPFLNWLFLTSCFLKLMITSKRDKQSISLNNYGEVFPIICDLCYVNSIPLFSIYKNSKMNPFRLPFWPLTSKIYYLLYIALKTLFKQSKIITNSKFNSEIIKNHTNKSSLIIHPPVKIPNLTYNEAHKKNIVLTISRITTMKNLNAIPKIAKKVKTNDCLFVLMGKTDDTSERVLKEIYDLSIELDINNRVNIFSDPPQSVLRNMISKASIYLSTQPSEAFGIAIIEAMTSGCIPVVPKSGGPWMDILDKRQRHYGFAFTNFSEASECIDLILSNRELKMEMAEKARKRATIFDERNFHRKFLEIIKKFTDSELIER